MGTREPVLGNGRCDPPVACLNFAGAEQIQVPFVFMDPRTEPENWRSDGRNRKTEERRIPGRVRLRTGPLEAIIRERPGSSRCFGLRPRDIDLFVIELMDKAKRPP